VGLETFKLPFGHRGANHPVKDLASGRIDITSQNHGFAVRGPDGGGRIEVDQPVRWETDFGAAELTHLNPGTTKATSKNSPSSGTWTR
jgi:carbamoyl-phosphate synthase small subunit